jgi:hypothetical protein
MEFTLRAHVPTGTIMIGDRQVAYPRFPKVKEMREARRWTAQALRHYRRRRIREERKR